MSKNVSRFLRVILVAGLCAVLLPAAVASAGSFRAGTGSLTLNSKLVKKLKKKGVKASKKATFSYSSAVAPFIQINMNTGQATALSLNGGSIKFKAGKAKATVTNLKLNGGVLSGKLGGKTLAFPLSGGTTTTPAPPHAVSVTVSGVTVTMTKGDAKRLNKALKVKAFKKGTLGTLSYDGVNRQLLEQAGTGINNESVTCSDFAEASKNASNDITASPIAPAAADLVNCPGPQYGADYPNISGGVVDAATGFGTVDVGGGTNDHCNPGGHCSPVGQDAPFTSPIFELNAHPTVSAVLPVKGRTEVLDVTLTSTPVLVAGKDTGSLSVPSSTLKLNLTTAQLLNVTFSPSNPYTAGETYGTSKLTVQFK